MPVKGCILAVPFYAVAVESYCGISSHSLTHTRYSSGRGIGPSQRPLPENTQPSQDPSIALDRIRTRNPSKRVSVDSLLRWRNVTHPL